MSNPVNKSKSKSNSVAAAPKGAPAIEPSAGESAYYSVAGLLNEIPRDETQYINVNVQTAAVYALGVSRFILEPALRARFAKLAKTGEYDDACVNDLGTAAQAAWYARHRYLLAMATRSEAQLPQPMLDAATVLRGRMLRLADYWLLDDKAVAPELDAIRAGTGYQDLANDLIALAALCEKHEPLLSQDRKLYQAGDCGLAKQLANDIVEGLGKAAASEENEWCLAQARAWTFLAQTYEEVRRGGCFLFPGEAGEARFPSLVAVTRAVRTSKNNAAAPAAEPGKEATPPA